MRARACACACVRVCVQAARGDRYLSHGAEHFGVAVDDDGHRPDEAQQRVQDEVAVVAPGPLLPAQGAGGLHSLGAVRAPAQQRSHGPEQAEAPDEEQAQSAPPHGELEARLGPAHHVVALVGQQCQGAEGHQTCEEAENTAT